MADWFSGVSEPCDNPMDSMARTMIHATRARATCLSSARNDKPRGPLGGSLPQYVLVHVRIVRPVGTRRKIRRRELPVTDRVVQPTQEPVPLLLFGEVEKEFEYPRPVPIEMVGSAQLSVDSAG
jgi:hypothetical protein